MAVPDPGAGSQLAECHAVRAHGVVAHTLHHVGGMRTTPTQPSMLPSISTDALVTVTGGCGKKRSCPPPQPMVAEPAPTPSGPEVSTSVNISYA